MLTEAAKPVVPKGPIKAIELINFARSVKLVNKRPKAAALAKLESDCFLNLQILRLRLNKEEIISLMWVNNDNDKKKLGIMSNIIWKKWGWEILKDNHEKWIIKLGYMLDFSTLNPLILCNLQINVCEIFIKLSLSVNRNFCKGDLSTHLTNLSVT